MYMPYLMYGYAVAIVMLVVGCRVCAWSVPGLRGMTELNWSFVCSLAAVLLLAQREFAPQWLTILVANQAMFCYWLLVYCAAAKILGARMRFLSLGLAGQAIAMVGMWYFTYPHPNLPVRILIVSAVGILEAVVTAITLFAYKEPESDLKAEPSVRSQTWVLAWIASIEAAVLLLRCILTELFPIHDFVHLNVVEVSFTYLNMLINAAGGCGLMWLALWMHRQDLHVLAQTDSLTGLLNRRAFEEILARELTRQPVGDSLVVLLADIDHFKEVNDKWGHPAGDEVIRKVGWTMRGEMRPHDVVARIGGEEYAVLLRNVSEAQAEEIAERVREKVAALDGLPGRTHVTISIGVAANYTVDTPGELLGRCDVATYRSKQAGRNLVTAYSSFPGKSGIAVRAV